MPRRSFMFLLLFTALISPVLAQTRTESSPQFYVPVFMPQRVDPAADLQRARQLEQTGQVEQALVLYERVLTVAPTNAEALAALQRLYLQLKRYEQAITLLNRQVEQAPKNVVSRRLLADVLLRVERTEEGRGQCNAILSIDPRNESLYRLVATLYLEHGLFDDAVEAYRRGRATSKQPAAFALDLANLYVAQSDIPRAIGEYLLWLKAQPNQFALADDYIEGLGAQTGGAGVEQALKDAAALSPPQVDVLRLLGNVYIRRGQPSQALAHYQRADSLAGGKGTYLLEFAAWCEREQFFEEAMHAYQDVLHVLLPPIVTAQAALGLARSFIALGRVEEALTAYRQVIEHHPKTRESEEALFQVAELQLTKQHDPKAAVETYRSLLSAAPRTARREDCLFRVADCFVALGKIPEATTQYKAILNPKASGLPDFGDRAKERASFGLAELALFQGQFDEAAAQFNDLAQRSPGGVFANDALQWGLLIDEAREGGDEILQSYVQALLLTRQYRTPEALEQYKLLLSERPTSPISDVAVLQIGLLLDELGKPLEAIAAYRDLMEQYPNSRHAAEAQRRIAELYETRLQDIPQAITEYETVLTRYPDSLFADTVRRKLRVLSSRHLPRP